jgi:hypothetical protein
MYTLTNGDIDEQQTKTRSRRTTNQIRQSQIPQRNSPSRNSRNSRMGLKTTSQKQLGGETTAQKSLTQIPPSTQKETPKPTVKVEPIPTTPKQQTPTPEPKKIIPEETQILLDYLQAQQQTYEALTEIAWATRQKILNQHIPQPTQPNEQKETEEQRINTDMNEAALKAKFPQNLTSMLEFISKLNYWVIKPKQFLGSENFTTLNSTVRSLNGEYISAGRDSHFRVYKE